MEEKKVYNLNNDGLIQACLAEYKIRAKDAKSNRNNEHKLIFLGKHDSSFWDQNKELYDFVEKNTYPPKAPIWMTFFKIYDESEYMALHIDDGGEFKDHNQYTNSILIYKETDTIGGSLVFAGKGWPPPRGELGELILVDQDVPGDLVWWDNKQVHGVSEIKSGSRIALIVFKKMDIK